MHPFSFFFVLYFFLFSFPFFSFCLFFIHYFQFYCLPCVLPFFRDGLSRSVYWLGFMLNDRGLMVRLQAEATGCSLLQNIQTGCEAHSASYSRLIQGTFVGLRWLWVWNQPIILPVPRLRIRGVVHLHSHTP
jgi:hypothetical protein